MGQIALITGGARSGKSTFAEEHVRTFGGVIGYIATAEPFDEGMKDRIKKHINQRPDHWTTYECYKEISPYIGEISKSCDTILLDCITVMVTNLMFSHSEEWTQITRDEIDRIEKEIILEVDALVEKIRLSGMDGVLVTNEVGAGIVPENRLARLFRDIAGRVNQRLAKQVDEVYFVVSGIPMKIK